MKKLTILLAVLLLASCLCACGQESAAAPDMQERFEALQKAEGAPGMLQVPAEKCVFLYGIAQEDCKQQVVAICEDSLRADEYWLIEAVDAAAADRIEALAQTRLAQKADELESYLPEQYEVVKQAKLLRRGNCVILLVSPQAETLAHSFD